MGILNFFLMNGILLLVIAALAALTGQFVCGRCGSYRPGAGQPCLTSGCIASEAHALREAQRLARG
jgi:hypothetical protein